MMPRYEYECRQCRQRLEAVQSYSAPPLTECAACGGELRRLIAPPAIIFRGPGFYTTDHRAPQPTDDEAAAP